MFMLQILNDLVRCYINDLYAFSFTEKIQKPMNTQTINFKKFNWLNTSYPTLK